MTITTANLTQMRALISRLQREGIRVALQNGWDHIDAGGSFGPWVDLIDHHDASSVLSGTWGALGTIIRGRPADGIPGPLSQLQVARGTIPQIAVVTAGRGNHAGVGGPLAGVPRDSGNRWLLGMEKANSGVGEPYSDATLFVAECVGYHAKELAA